MSPEPQAPREFRTGLHADAEQSAVVAGAQIPQVLLAYPQWVCWRYVSRGQGKKPDKRPVNPHNLHNAGVRWANTWTTFAHAYTTYLMYEGRGLHGIGFVLTPDDPFVGVDIDNCVEAGELEPSALDIVRHFASYTEVSPSQHGLRILIACPAFSENARTPALEIYSHSRFLTLTGHHVEGTPATIAEVEQERITALRPQPVEPPRTVTSLARPSIEPVDGTALWARIFEHDRYGAQHLRRFQGDTSLDRDDHSLACIRLLNCLARWTHGDAATMRAMMLLSPLANEKWFSKRGKRDWLDYQIADAIRFVNRRK